VFGIELSEVFLLAKQLGFALAGAAALWGFVFSVRDFKCGERDCLIYDWLSSKLYFLLFLGGLFGVIFHQVVQSVLPALAHEGVVLYPRISDFHRALQITEPVVWLVAILLLLSLIINRLKNKLFYKFLSPFYLVSFILFFFLTAFPAWIGEFSRLQFFFNGHGFHSIFTLGTVLVLDYLFIISRNSFHLKQHIYPMFSTISKVIWAGLAVDFLSALLIIENFVVNPKFLFAQTVIGIIIINGVFLSGPVARRLFASARNGESRMEGGWQILANLAGVISVSSWLSITVVDFFENLTLSYGALFGLYVSLIVIIFIGHQFLEAMEAKDKPPVFIH